MVNPEDPTVTLVRLLGTYLRVIKDDNSIAKVSVSQEWFNRELFKTYDGQVTVGLQSSTDKKLSLTGKVRGSALVPTV